MNDVLLAHDWKDYELIACGGGEKLERWGGFTLLRPEPQAIWPMPEAFKKRKLDARYERSSSGGGEWTFLRDLPEKWTIQKGGLKFVVRPTGFKHTGLFPEQAVNWTFMGDMIERANRPIQVLNLFAYTGGATLACAKAGASVVHVDAAKGMVAWAKENARASGLDAAPIRYIVDDCLKFVLREQRRGRKYDAIVMDPPSYGRGPDGEMWKMEDKFYELVCACTEIMSDNPLFFLVNAYSKGLSAILIENVYKLTLLKRFSGRMECKSLALPMSEMELQLPCGVTGRWMTEE